VLATVRRSNCTGGFPASYVAGHIMQSIFRPAARRTILREKPQMLTAAPVG
jgi:hypothetical protein